MKTLIIIPALLLSLFTKAQSKIEARIRQLAGEYNKNALLIKVSNIDSLEKKILKRNLSYCRDRFSYSEDENAGSFGGSKTIIQDHHKPFVYYDIKTNIYGGTIIEVISGSNAF